MNIPSIEIGWIIKSRGSFIYEGPLFDNAAEDDNGYWIPDENGVPLLNENDDRFYIETHPTDTDRVFVSLCEAGHGYDLEGDNEPRHFGTAIRAYIKKLDPSTTVTFGIIETER